MNAHETRVKRGRAAAGNGSAGNGSATTRPRAAVCQKTLLKWGASGPEPGRACARVHVRSRECADENQEHECL